MTRILFITATRIGDAILSSGLLDHVLGSYPDPRVTIACGPLAAPLFRAVPGLERVIVMTKQKGGGHWFDLWRNTVTHRWDMVIDLRESATSWFLLAGRRHVKRNWPGDGTPVHRVEEAAAFLGITPPPSPVLWLDDLARARARALMPDAPVLALAPAAAARFKEWAPERFAALALALTGTGGALAGAHVAIFGGPGDEATARAVTARLDRGRTHDFTGQLDLLETGACLSRAALFVGNDSGLMHMAAAAGAPTLGLFGPTDERVYGPWGRRTASVRAGEQVDERTRDKVKSSRTSLLADLELAPVLAAADNLIKAETTP
ncbi:glycosyl transferase [Glycocaulis albus]|uniref:Glycosyl transferase n=1 Tax=Glycocaulis albus TaxID=1382801 RepID=A0ABQ1XXC5_9PROT|nr:glycosyltransferase family 9 protein [Glycocaulis albus]MBV5259324.1 glycosyltransferase family 9 protein [Synechococcus moorigangaii CMS01]GGH05504.1 glycosyl transferase [Glycocaulis albus]